MRRKTIVIIVVVIAFTAFLAWRFLRPMNIFVVSEAFERPIPVKQLPASVTSQSAKACAQCHAEIYSEWSTAMHSRAWTDPYFQTDWKFDDSRQICKNCHIPLEDQQEHLVTGFRDKDKWEPILESNPRFDADLQHEGVTCNVCHLREGRILGPYGDTRAPHAITKMEDPNQVCLHCHVVQGKRWDTFFRMPPCGTVVEIESAVEKINCVQCHMPTVQRPLVAGGLIRAARRHLWRGGHDPEIVKRALKVEFSEKTIDTDRHRVTATLTNMGATHFLPTGTPDRYLTVTLQVLDASGKVLKSQEETLKRTVMWRPFIVDLWDTRLPYQQPRTYTMDFSTGGGKARLVEIVVRYHLLDEARRKRIQYENKESIFYDIYRESISIKQ
ncbi:multiheme c-type cytochrome [Ferrigenium sp. UT5]|uniref:multiheme c-type cytochrome n=1 Tax=Ferrigenium sp. UT5 TaxID=3242105 RepID=UPI0035531136